MHHLGKTVKMVSIFAGITIAYIVAGKLGLLLAIVQANATAVWAPTGIAIAALLLFGYRFAPAIFLAAFVTNVTTAGSPLTSLGIATGNMLEGVIAAYLVTRFASGTKAFESGIGVIKYGFWAGILSTMVSATIGVTTLSLGGFSSWAHYGAVWITWWLGDLGGAIIVAPMLLLWLTNYRIKWSMPKFIETFFLLVVLSVFTFLTIAAKFAFLFIFITPILIWIAFRFERRVLALVIFFITELYVWQISVAILNSPDPSAVNQSLVLLQAFMSTTAVGMMALAASLAEQREAQTNILVYIERMSQEKALDDAILASIGDGLVVSDRNGNVILMNPQAQIMFNRKLKDALGKPVADVIPIEDEKGDLVSMNERPLAMALSGGGATSTAGVVPYYYVRDNKSRFPVALTASPIMIDGVVMGAVDLVKDITAEKEMDREKSEFISIAAHQLRTPLSSIKWVIELLMESNMTDAQHKKLVEISDSNERLINVVRNLLSITRTENGKIKITPELIDVKGVVANVIHLCERDAAEKKLTIHYAPEAKPYTVTTDRTLFAEAVKNILDNAVIYSRDNSTIEVSVEEQEKGYAVSITNDGPAIADEDRPNLFKRFYRGVLASRLKPSGSGLGLYIAKLNIENLGGSIRLESPVHGNSGVTFRVSIPIQHFI